MRQRRGAPPPRHRPIGAASAISISDGRPVLAGAVQMGDEAAAEILEAARIGRSRLAEPGEHDVADRQVRRRQDRQQLVLLAFEPRAAASALLTAPPGGLIQLPGGRGQRALFPNADHDDAGARRPGSAKLIFMRATFKQDFGAGRSAAPTAQKPACNDCDTQSTHRRTRARNPRCDRPPRNAAGPGLTALPMIRHR